MRAWEGAALRVVLMRLHMTFQRGRHFGRLRADEAAVHVLRRAVTHCAVIVERRCVLKELIATHYILN